MLLRTTRVPSEKTQLFIPPIYVRMWKYDANLGFRGLGGVATGNWEVERYLHGKCLNLDDTVPSVPSLRFTAELKLNSITTWTHKFFKQRKQNKFIKYLCLENGGVSLSGGDTGEWELLGKWFDSWSPPPELAGPAGGAEEAIGAFLTNHATNQTNPREKKY